MGLSASKKMNCYLQFNDPESTFFSVDTTSCDCTAQALKSWLVQLGLVGAAFLRCGKLWMRIFGPLFAGGTRPGVSLTSRASHGFSSIVVTFLGEVTCMVLGVESRLGSLMEVSICLVT